MEIEHFSHEHVLSLSEKKREDEVLCKACNLNCVGPTYSCRELCGFALHESCAMLPQELHNPLHPHPLGLHPQGQFRCYACARDCSGFSFRCDKCDVNLDLKCAFIRPAVEEREEPVGIHFSHQQHPLRLFQNMPARRIICRACDTYCSDPTYGCFPCRFFIHRSCFNLPQQIICPFHPYHPLALIILLHGGRCNACRKDIRSDNLAYVCQGNNCSFRLHLKCTSVIMPAVTYDAHDHLLLFNDNIEKIGYNLKCSACKSSCASYGFSCLYCDFNLHHTCGPLPSTIRHKCHIDALILTSSPVEDEEDCEPDDFYCDACEEQRVDPFLPVYYCKDCHFVADVKCVISEVLSLPKGKHGDVELRNPFGQFGKLIREKQQLVINPALTLFDILKSLSEAEKMELSNALRATGWKTITSKNSEYIEIFGGDDAYTQFMTFVDIGTEIPTEFLDIPEAYISRFKFRFKQPPKEEIVNIGDYKVTRKLAPIFKDLLSKHGDVSAESKLSPKVKLYFFHMLCECIYGMINTKVVDITKNDLLNWWASLETSKFAGFRIQFAYDHLKRVALAHFGLSVEKQGSKALDQLDIDIEALKGKHERLKSIKSRIVEKCSRETSILKGGKVGVGL